MTVQNDLSPDDVAAYEAELAKRTPSLYARYIGAMLYFMGAASSPAPSSTTRSTRRSTR